MRHRTDRIRRLARRLRRVLPGPEAVASAAAAAGDPTEMLALKRRRDPEATGRSVPSRHTAWARGVSAPTRGFLAAETGGAALLVAAIVLALAWSNSPWRGTYTSVWSSVISINLAGHAITTDLRGTVNEGLMTLFFLVVGLEAKRELDLGELRDRRRLTVPVIAGCAGMVASVAVYLALTAGRQGAGGWGVAVSTDTALALGTLTLTTGNRGNRIRVFLLTLLVVDDLAALAIVAFVYPAPIDPAALVAAGILLALLLGLRALGLRWRDRGNSGIALFAISVLTGLGLWLALFESGIDPVICGLFIGLLTSAYAPRRSDLEHGAELVQSFREQPTPALAYSARAGLAAAISPNDRLQYRLHPWTGMVIVPLFALANAGVHLDGSVLKAALSSPVTWGVVLGFVVGKPIGILAAAWLTARGAPRAGKLPVSWRELCGTAGSAGVAFTASLLIASRAFDGALLDQAKVGVLATALISPLLAAASFWPLHAGRTPATARERLAVPDLALDVDPARDHIRGPVDAPVTLLAYISLGCRHCAAAAPLVTELLDRFPGRLRYVMRHLPLTDIDANAQLAAEALEAAGGQDAFWTVHDTLTQTAEPVGLGAIYRAAHGLGLDLDRLFADLDSHAYAPHIAADVRSADASGVAGTPAFFIDGRRWSGPADRQALGAAIAEEVARENPDALSDAAPAGLAAST
jgi:Na+/H+ antiporter NhaA/protein-disulfide isomerase